MIQHRHDQHDRRPSCHVSGFTLVEVMIAIAITGLISAAAAAMLSAVAQASAFEQDRREAIVRAQALGVRLSSYITPSRYILDHTQSKLVLWLDDNRTSETVHASEVRWIYYDSGSDTTRLYYVHFPEEWSETQREQFDTELTADSNWDDVLNTFSTNGYIEAIRFSDKISEYVVDRNEENIQGKRIVTFTVSFAGQTGLQTIVTSASIREYKEPTL